MSCLTVVSLPGVAAGQADSQVARIFEIRVKPGMIAQFEQARRERNAHWASAGFTYPLQISVGENFVYRVVGLFPDEETLQARSEAAAQARATEDDSIQERFNEAIVSRTVSTFRTVTEAAHAPATPRLQADEIGFIHYIIPVPAGRCGRPSP